MDFCKCCDTVMLRYCYFLLTLLISPLTLHLNSLCCCIIVIIDHRNIGVDITFSVLSCLVQEIWHKIHNLVMAESKMVAMATTRCFCDGSISENVQGTNLFNCTKFHAFMKKWTYHLKFCTYHLDQGSATPRLPSRMRLFHPSAVAPCSVGVQYAGEVSPRLLIQPFNLPLLFFSVKCVKVEVFKGQCE